jgi:hypothetical protein
VVFDPMRPPPRAGPTIHSVYTTDTQGFTTYTPTAGGSCACGDTVHCARALP